MTENIKNTAITAAGYVYQNRHGLKVLCDWLDAPTRYYRMKFECDDDNEAPQALDDIVVERTDGLVDLQQVKFTPNPDVHLLCWDWMLEKTGKTSRSRSMLRKWFDAFKKLDPSRIGEISLTTNRRPDAAIEACLDGAKILFAKIPEPKRSEVIAELGSSEECEVFFDQLLIRHSDKGYIALEHYIDAQLRKHGTLEGIATLKSAALNWAILKNSPPPDGWIKLEAVRTILQATPPTPLPEDFVVPKGYEVPDEKFHQDFLQDAIDSVGKVIVLTGPPGRGKSTYLSALCDTLAEQVIPTVRHHYFLSTTERGRDRVHTYVVEQSIKAQIESFHQEVPRTTGGLRELLKACASHYKEEGKPFVLILDGLDHVWRINSGDKRPLEDIFSQVIPCPDNMVLLVGTQPVDDAHLPSDLLVSAPKAEWRTLPAMSENAVLSYLRKAVQEARLTTGMEDERQAEEQLQRAASALRSRTNGHPLHVIYATAELEHTRGRLSEWDVEQLKGDLSQDAKFYYGSLWESLPPSLKDTLRLICAFPFFWPKTAFVEIATTIKAAEPDVGSVQHILHSSAAGLRVFHESLAVFVCGTIGYEDRINELMPTVADWLEHSAPTSLRVNWLWTVQAKLGAPQNLITGLTRDWIMLRLEEGYPESLFDTLLSDAIVAAIETTMFADAYRLQHLKFRMVDGSTYQMQNDDLARIISLTMTLADERVLLESVASRHEMDILHIAALGLALLRRGDQVLAETCGEEVLRRFQGLSRFSNRYTSGSGSDELKFLANALAQLGTIGTTPESLSRLITENSSIVWLPRVQMLVGNGSLDELMAVAALLSTGGEKNIVSDACIRAAANVGVNICERDDFNVLARTPFVAAIEASLTRTSKLLHEPIQLDWLKGDYYERKEDLAALAHQWFFSAVHLGLCMAAESKSDFEYAQAPVYKDRENITDFLNALSAIGARVASHWWNGKFVGFHELFEMLEPVVFRGFRENHDRSSAAEDFRNVLHRIACDIHIGSVLLNNIDDVALTEETMNAAKSCVWFNGSSFRTQYASGSLTQMNDKAASAFIQFQRALFDAEVWEETSVRLQTPLQLCAIAITHSLTKEARELCNQTWELATGYGHRKDSTLSNTLHAINYLVDVAPEDARRLLEQIAPQIHNVLNYTDGKGTRHVLATADRLLAQLKPSALIVKYEEHTHTGEWSLGEDSLQAYVEQGVKEGWPLDALMHTGLHPEIHDSLQQLAQSGNESATERLRILQKHVGWDVGFLQRQEPAESDTEGQPYEGDVMTFEPEQFGDLLNSLSATSYNERTKLLRAWYQHWEAKGERKRLLDVYDHLVFDEGARQREILLLSDLAFESRRKWSGKDAAWKYLVHAQILNGGWYDYMEHEAETRDRLDLVVKYYPQRCDDFVVATTYSMFENPERQRLAPNDVMVYFYIRQGRIAEAVTFAESMVNCVIEDTRTLPLDPPRWASELFAPVA